MRQGPTVSDGHSPVLQDPFPWQQKVRFAKGIASGMVSPDNNPASSEDGWESEELQGLQADPVLVSPVDWVAQQLFLSCSLCQ